MSIKNVCYNNLKEDVLEIFKNIDNNMIIQEKNYYVYELINLIYDKHFKKYIYPEIIEQIISEFSDCNQNFIFNLSKSQIQINKNRVKELLEKPQSEQRSKAWYDKRYNTIGASETAAIFNKSRRTFGLTKGCWRWPNVTTIRRIIVTSLGPSAR